MLNFQAIKFTTKLFVGILTILVLSILIVNTVTTVQVRSGLFELGRDALENMNKPYSIP